MCVFCILLSKDGLQPFSYCSTIILTVLFLIPVVIVQGLAHLEQLEVWFPFLKNILQIRHSQDRVLKAKIRHLLVSDECITDMERVKYAKSFPESQMLSRNKPRQ